MGNNKESLSTSMIHSSIYENDSSPVSCILWNLDSMLSFVTEHQISCLVKQEGRDIEFLISCDQNMERGEMALVS